MAGPRRSLTGPLPHPEVVVAASPSPASRSPLRIAGIALLGVGVIAAFAGLISTTQGDGNGTVAQAPTSSAQVLDPTAEAALPTAPASPAPDAAATAPFVPGSTADGSTGEGAPPASAPAAVPEQPPVIAAPAPGQTGPDGTGGGAAAQAPAGGQPAVRAPLRVYNNSLVPGLAARAAENFKSAGWTIDEVGGFQGRLLESAAYYRPGTAEEAAAKELAAQFELVAKPRFAEIQGARPGVIVILIRDYAERGKS
jgi:hypothetical protein